MTILVLAGSAEARAVIAALREAGAPTIASLAGVTRRPAPLGVPTWRGGFGGAEPMARRLREAGVRVVVDATHPFARRISARTAEICDRLGVARIALVRPPWREPEPGAWRRFATLEAALEALPAGARVLAALGAGATARLGARPDLRFLARVAEAPAPDAPPPPPNVELIARRPPLSESDERALMREAGIDILLTRNSGGPTDAKLAAAQALGVEIAMIDRPPPPPPPHARDAAEAAAWALARWRERAAPSA
ncbi:precorrin-6A/cobalt-precorrin-6A reductase [Oceanicella actignis]|uniref:Precorrin-6A/cobalt-precorrin-6A reductase n=1 Tax=Oceanicella actignis TaxID=1189325 RepID=A0A1M7SNV4_9RHOB|nr:precorrin-6A/cobalt-precorrin-6A reductase [Oceanicella actignis]SES64981.1 precorrin-6A reductase [Oceanicella actignis]SHN60183.1 precorrin-6A/cobalt-precorrin-6A reductase [Oceanicella actignis]